MAKKHMAITIGSLKVSILNMFTNEYEYSLIVDHVISFIY